MSKHSPQLPASAPRFGNTFTRFIGRLLLRIVGYKVAGRFADEPKMILIAAPHTSNWDLIIAFGTILSLGVRINFMMKKEAFFFPFKGLFMALGGIPVDRSNPKRVVVQTLRNFRDNEKFWLAILPEGTRKPVTSWKAGFMRIAKQADVPIFIMGVDSRTKTLVLDRLVDENEDAQALRQYVKQRFTGVNPRND